MRYFASSTGQTLAQERYVATGVDAVDDADAGTSTWLLRDPEGNIGTHVKSDATVTKQASYDPYGSPDLGGTSGDSNSTLGFQSDHTDDATGNLLLGPRVYDPEIDRFTTADYFVGSGSDMSLGTDPLTGNRYLFAAANPVAFYEDGHEPCPADPCDKYYSGTKKQQRQRARGAFTRAFLGGETDPAELISLLHTALVSGLPNPPARSLGPAPTALLPEKIALRSIAAAQYYKVWRWSRLVGQGLGAVGAADDYGDFREEGDDPFIAAGRSGSRWGGATVAGSVGKLLFCTGAGLGCVAVAVLSGAAGGLGGGILGDLIFRESTMAAAKHVGSFVGPVTTSACGPGMYYARPDTC